MVLAGWKLFFRRAFAHFFAGKGGKFLPEFIVCGACHLGAFGFNLTRDLHCWEMTFSCIPFGTHQSYNFQINVRSSLLKDLKLTKRDSWYDRR